MSGSFRSRLLARTGSGVAGVAYVGAALVVSGLISKHVGHATVVQGASMKPTFPACCAVVWCDILGLRWAPPRVGDVVAALVGTSSDLKKESGVVKRVAGVAGDVLFDPETGVTVVVPEGHVWLLGDNPDESRDSRVYGPVSIANVKARVRFRCPLMCANCLFGLT